ncbi:peptidoglycan-associated lipoprotein [Coxiella burnetii]|uniref:Peptidoglycan-associated protein n=2 Tax=Coxiella burnetii TaxID=777 RepID=Q83F58_COXBU|nr:OmpA family protein [Coxiella burnetii]NP_819143.2 peptidoglycan-associated lipoprotein [Coxiella burnetii RSA 493]ACJ21072.1 peptidoglycan-associated lipoprotein [Coxiella burnetii CbuK_Q154]AAO89657.2 peptidoglycan-associated lipoprotein [Coxiella burnetii RSA 493]ARI65010.1 peptidoglycan-associated lipoprotein [Coxiella burnetii]OYK85002.1 peptidoglycan-associated lipoprotein [Coxiella burnetii]OYK88821.1 peptidoglycan-associated lipoprotein [Coxiella burnetii]
MSRKFTDKIKGIVMNNLVKNSGLAVIALATLNLSGCKHHPAGANAATGLSDGTGAQAYALAEGKGYQGQLKKDSEGRIINPLVAPANQTYYFDFDSTQLRSLDLGAIRVQANYLATHSTAKVRLEGNTDNRGSREYNIGLGWRRDQAVARILEQEGVAPKQIDMVSYGKERPAVMGNNENAWRLNRRVNLIYEAY